MDNPGLNHHKSQSLAQVPTATEEVDMAAAGIWSQQQHASPGSQEQQRPYIATAAGAAVATERVDTTMLAMAREEGNVGQDDEEVPLDEGELCMLRQLMCETPTGRGSGITILSTPTDETGFTIPFQEHLCQHYQQRYTQEQQQEHWQQREQGIDTALLDEMEDEVSTFFALLEEEEGEPSLHLASSTTTGPLGGPPAAATSAAAAAAAPTTDDGLQSLPLQHRRQQQHEQHRHQQQQEMQQQQHYDERNFAFPFEEADHEVFSQSQLEHQLQNQPQHYYQQHDCHDTLYLPVFASPRNAPCVLTVAEEAALPPPAAGTVGHSRHPSSRAAKAAAEPRPASVEVAAAVETLSSLFTPWSAAALAAAAGSSSFSSTSSPPSSGSFPSRSLPTNSTPSFSKHNTSCCFSPPLLSPHRSHSAHPPALNPPNPTGPPRPTASRHPIHQPSLLPVVIRILIIDESLACLRTTVTFLQSSLAGAVAAAAAATAATATATAANATATTTTTTTAVSIPNATASGVCTNINAAAAASFSLPSTPESASAAAPTDRSQGEKEGESPAPRTIAKAVIASQSGQAAAESSPPLPKPALFPSIFPHIHRLHFVVDAARDTLMGLEHFSRHDPDVVLLSHTLHIHTPPSAVVLPPATESAAEEVEATHGAAEGAATVASGASEMAKRMKQEWGYTGAVLLLVGREGEMEEGQKEQGVKSRGRQRVKCRRLALPAPSVVDRNKESEEKQVRACEKENKDNNDEMESQEDKSMEGRKEGIGKREQGNSGIFDGCVTRPFSASSLLRSLLDVIEPRLGDEIPYCPTLWSSFPPATEATAAPLHPCTFPPHPHLERNHFPSYCRRPSPPPPPSSISPFLPSQALFPPPPLSSSSFSKKHSDTPLHQGIL